MVERGPRERSTGAPRGRAGGRDRETGGPREGRGGPRRDAPRALEGLSVGVQAVRTALSVNPRRVERLMIARGRRDGRTAELVALAREAGVPFQQVPEQALERLAGGLRHQGVAARLSGCDLLHADELVERLPEKGLSLVLDGGKKAAFDFLRHLEITRNAVSLGGMESLACHPATTTHSEMSAEELEAAGVADGLVRISVGIEDVRDLRRDFLRALDQS